MGDLEETVFTLSNLRVHLRTAMEGANDRPYLEMWRVHNMTWHPMREVSEAVSEAAVGGVEVALFERGERDA